MCNIVGHGQITLDSMPIYISGPALKWIRDICMQPKIMIRKLLAITSCNKSTGSHNKSNISIEVEVQVVWLQIRKENAYVSEHLNTLHASE